MATFSDYCIGTIKMHKLLTVKDYRLFAEQIVAHFDYLRIIRFSTHARPTKELFFGDYQVKQYSKTKSSYFDGVNLEDIGGLGFEATNVKGSHISNFFLDFDFAHEDNSVYISLVLDSLEGAGNYLLNLADQCLVLLQDVSTIEFLQSDRMDSSKWVPAFVSGTGQKPKRSEFENAVAFSLSQTRRFHHKPPFLFVHNYIKMDSAIIQILPQQVVSEEKDGFATLFIPSCIGKELNQYPMIPEWISVYRTLKENGIIKVDDKLDLMVERMSML